MNKDFTEFKECFKEWQLKFGLTGYKVYFRYEPLGEKFGQLIYEIGSSVVTVCLNSKLPQKDKQFKDVKRTAKHEAMHLLVLRLEMNGKCRFTTEAEIDEAGEGLVIRLEGLIA